MNQWVMILIAMLEAAEPNLSPELKAAMAIVIQLVPIYTAKTPGWIEFQPDAAGGTPVQLFHIQP